MNYERLSEQITPFNIAASGVINQIIGLYTQNGYSQVDANSTTIYTITQFIYRQAYVDGIDFAISGATVATGIGLLLVIFMRSKPKEKIEATF